MGLQDPEAPLDLLALEPETASLAYLDGRGRGGSPECWASREDQGLLEVLERREQRDFLETKEETEHRDCSELQDSKVTVATQVALAPPLLHPGRSTWRRGREETAEGVDFLVSLVLEVIRGSQASRAARVSQGCLVFRTRAREPPDSRASQGPLDPRAFRAPRGPLASWVSLECLDPGVMMADLVFLAILVDLASLEPKVREETPSASPERPDPRASQETLASQVGVATTASLETTVTQDPLGLTDRRVPPENLDGLGYRALLVSQALRARMATQEQQDRVGGQGANLGPLEPLEVKVCRAPLVWTG